VECAKEMLRAEDIAPMLGVSRSRIYQLVRAGTIPAVRDGRVVWIPRRAMELWLERTSDRALRAAGVTSP
jgi:excisionase family DNA binding protein